MVDFIEKRLEKLELFYSKIINADVYLKLENTSGPENKITEIRLFVPGDDLVVSKTCNSFEACVDECAASLERMLKKRKGKEISQA